MQRLDTELVNRDLARSRAHAQQLVKAGRVQCERAGLWQTLAKVSVKIDAGENLRVLPGDEDRYVSRGGLKLAGALQQTGVSVKDLTVLDVGQSTGGFTDCLLQAGAARVIGVDVGRDQLFPALRNDERVVCCEGVNARELPSQLCADYAPEGFAVAVMDVSFISQTLILPSLASLLKPGGQLLSLVKPQFEVGREGIGKGGIVRDASQYSQVEETIREVCQQQSLRVKDYFSSPIKGGDGNREFFVWVEKQGC
ncbi:TlyA family RNA methyltransferase [Gilvimarinus xylanilyticus]|uniref:TlyA family RNA methyltransferase n=1 Tax=Gilvimarinus xylanilyticus TaxID=2944139 RepID=A0A9X2I6R0_9GAMM|nr:TlyA family RNA methyltransferase [Gilvimarinus xylanilyticus]MCP8900472.1 TlyA family RNA methyltransferase [Gilvimarinus xylanilyticus]